MQPLLLLEQLGPQTTNVLSPIYEIPFLPCTGYQGRIERDKHARARRKSKIYFDTRQASKTARRQSCCILSLYEVHTWGINPDLNGGGWAKRLNKGKTSRGSCGTEGLCCLIRQLIGALAGWLSICS